MKISILQIARRLRRRLALYLLTCITLLLGSLGAQTQPAGSIKRGQQPGQNAATSSVSSPAQDPGERKFQANCSRCHTAPEQLSPRIVGTVARHMRVRASLSAEDERDILRYLAP